MRVKLRYNAGMNITVFCSQYDVAEPYRAAVEDLAQRIAAGGHTLVFGGGDTGLMHTLALGVHTHGGRVVGVIRKPIAKEAYQDADEMHVVADTREMNRGLIERGDVIVALIGGVGTLNELSDLLRSLKNGTSRKPVVVVNTDGFYDGLKQQLLRMQKEGFVRDDVMRSVCFADTPEDAMRYIEGNGN